MKWLSETARNTGAWTMSAAPREAHAQTKPNILLIVADDMGWSDIAPFGGEIPPVDDRTQWIEPRCLANTRAMSFIDCPRFHRSQSSFFCDAESLGPLVLAICDTSWVMN